MLNESWDPPMAEELRLRYPAPGSSMQREDSGDEWHLLDDDELEFSTRQPSTSTSHQDQAAAYQSAAATVFVKQLGQLAWRVASKKIPEYAWLSIICGQTALEWGLDSSASAYEWVRNVSQLNRLLKEKSEAENMSSVQANLLEALRLEKEAKERQLHFEREKFLALRDSSSKHEDDVMNSTAHLREFEAQKESELRQLQAERDDLRQREEQQRTMLEQSQRTIAAKENEIVDERRRVEEGAREVEEQLLERMRLMEIENTELQQVKTLLEAERTERELKEVELEQMTQQLQERQAAPSSNSASPDIIEAGAKEALIEEVTCCICDELLENASTLQCSHSFCQQCIESWIAREGARNKGKPSCPSCRAPIKLPPTRTLVLDKVVQRLKNASPNSDL